MASDYVLATVTRLALAGHAIPVDAPTLRALRRLGIADDSTDVPTLRGILERAVPKNRGVEFSDLIEELAHDTCVEGEPDCPECERPAEDLSDRPFPESRDRRRGQVVEVCRFQGVEGRGEGKGRQGEVDRTHRARRFC